MCSLIGCIAPHLHVSVLPWGWQQVHHNIRGDHTMPSAPDWRSASAYAYLDELNTAEIAVEFLRRNPAYRRDYRTALNRAPDGRSTALITRWGLRFPFRSGRARRPNYPGLAASSCSCGCSSRARAGGIRRRPQHRHAVANIPGRSKRGRVPRPSKSRSYRAHRRRNDCDSRRGRHSARSELRCPR